VTCLDGCCDTENPPKYLPITSGEHFIGKFVKKTTFGTGIAQPGRAPARPSGASDIASQGEVSRGYCRGKAKCAKH
jgi:hypothetical protein